MGKRGLVEMTEVKNIEIAIATYDKLCGLRDRIDKILNPHGRKRKLSFDDTIGIIIDVKGIEARLEEMIVNG